MTRPDDRHDLPCADPCARPDAALPAAAATPGAPVAPVTSLVHLGWTPHEARAHAALIAHDPTLADLQPARVSAIHGAASEVTLADASTRQAVLSGALRALLDSDRDAPGLAVGDWVLGVLLDDARVLITRRLERRGQLTRVRPGGRGDVQCIASNVDALWIATSCNRDFNPRRLERYVTVARQANALPLIALTKADLAAPTALDALRATLDALLGVPVVTTSLTSPEATARALADLRAHLTPGCTVALVGSSGVGKSSLINALRGDVVMTIGDIRDDDDRGRHTTTHRQLITLPDHRGLLIDTPGMRELGLTGDASPLNDVFDDINALATSCRFRDCQHVDEPGCAVLAAIDAGTLDPARLRARRKLERELARVAPASKAERARAHKKRRAFARTCRATMQHKQRERGDR